MALLSIRGLSLSFAEVRALDGVSLEVGDASLTAVVGPSGAGKTSLMSCIVGLYRPDAGRILLEGMDVTGLAPDRMTALGVVKLSRSPVLFDSLTVAENFLAGRDPELPGSLVRSLLGAPAANEDAGRHRRRAEEIVDVLGLADHRDAPASSLARGTRRRVEIGRALAAEPRILLVDDAAADLDADEADALTRCLADIRDRLRVTQVVIDHDAQRALDLADHAVALDAGTVIGDGDPDDIRRDPDVVRALAR